MPADVAGARRAEDRVGHRVAHGISVRMPCETTIERNRHSAQNQRPSFDKPVEVVAHSGATGTRSLPAKANFQVRAREILRIETPGGGGWGR